MVGTRLKPNPCHHFSPFPILTHTPFTLPTLFRLSTDLNILVLRTRCKISCNNFLWPRASFDFRGFTIFLTDFCHFPLLPLNSLSLSLSLSLSSLMFLVTSSLGEIRQRKAVSSGTCVVTFVTVAKRKT